MAKGIPFNRLAKVLEGLGFRLETIQGSHHLFTHDATHAHVALPIHERTVRRVFVAAIARTLDENGILDRDAFNRRLARTNGAPHAPLRS
jgi:predicted RNA binding protein YcfA (HicA-like mRNA interferase family)